MESLTHSDLVGSGSYKEVHRSERHPDKLIVTWRQPLTQNDQQALLHLNEIARGLLPGHLPQIFRIWDEDGRTKMEVERIRHDSQHAAINIPDLTNADEMRLSMKSLALTAVRGKLKEPELREISHRITDYGLSSYIDRAGHNVTFRNNGQIVFFDIQSPLWKGMLQFDPESLRRAVTNLHETTGPDANRKQALIRHFNALAKACNEELKYAAVNEI